MTAYARSTCEIEGQIWTIEVVSVNKKTLDIYLQMPKELLYLDQDLRKMIAKTAQRGQIVAKIEYKKSTLQIELPCLKNSKKEWGKIAKELGFSKKEITLSFLLEQVEQRVPISILSTQNEELLKEALQKALGSFTEMRKTEGMALEKDILTRIENLETLLEEIENYSELCSVKYQEKLRSKLKAILEEAVHNERVLGEVAIFATKVDITEEIVRLRSHFTQIKELFASKEKSIGRAIDFLTQELLRETNTICAKTPELEVTKRAITVKTELEKIKEQVQNIE